MPKPYRRRFEVFCSPILEHNGMVVAALRAVNPRRRNPYAIVNTSKFGVRDAKECGIWESIRNSSGRE